jgi:hypothetical protein
MAKRQLDWTTGGKTLRLSVSVWRGKKAWLPLFRLAIVRLHGDVPVGRVSISNPRLSGLMPRTWHIEESSTPDGLHGRAYLFLRLRIRFMRRMPSVMADPQG